MSVGNGKPADGGETVELAAGALASADGLHADLTEQIIGAAIEVHRHLGPGLLESAYEAALCWELTQRGIEHRRQVIVPVVYKGEVIDKAFRSDILVKELVLVELKAVDRLAPLDEAQLHSYLKLTGLRVGLLINFNVKVLVDGVRRRIL